MNAPEFSSKSVLRLENVLDTDYQWDILGWRNEPDVRRFMIDDTVINDETHEAYLEALRCSNRQRVYVLTDRAVPLMVWNVNIDHDEEAFFTGYYGIGGATPAQYVLYSSFVVRDSLFQMHPSYELRSQVLLENEKSWRFLERLGYSISKPYSGFLKSGRETEIVDVNCDRDMWLAGSAKTRPFYEDVIKKARSAQEMLVW